jgi:hypothetical protein
MKWQTLGTAPKDGTSVIMSGFYPDKSDGEVIVSGKFNTIDGMWEDYRGKLFLINKWIPTPLDNPKQTIVAAACRIIGTDKVVVSARHFDPLMHKIIGDFGKGDGEEWEQGFIDQRGNYLSREEALKIASNNGQSIDLSVGGSHCALYSECLY